MQSIFTVTENKLLARSTMKITLKGDTSLITRAGQFVNIKLEGCYLRRPISVCTKNDTSMTLIYKIVGKGTQILSKVCPGDKLDLLTGLGNGFDTSVKCISPLLVGGGAGCAPLFMLAETLKKEGKIPSAVLGFNTKDEIFLKDELESIGVKTFIATYDASEGTKGFVTDAIIKNNIETDYIFACGPYPCLLYTSLQSVLALVQA